MKCIVKNCPNHQSQGYGMLLMASHTEIEHHNENEAYFICMPCWLELTGRGDGHSWLLKQLQENNSK